jgi:hypothetical protein
MRKNLILLPVLALLISNITLAQGPIPWKQNGDAVGAGAVLGSTTNQAFSFITSGTPRMTILGNGGGTNGFVGIGTITPLQKLDVSNGNITLSTINKAYMIDGSQVLWHKGDVSNIFVGVGAGANNVAGQGLNNTFVGNNAGLNNVGSNISPATGQYNTAVGNNALKANQDGAFNVAIGTSALSKYNPTGLNTQEGNIAIGHNALAVDKNSQQNTAVGYQALSMNGANLPGDENTAVGTNALKLNRTGSKNTGMGDDVLSNNRKGKWNSGIGARYYLQIQ